VPPAPLAMPAVTMMKGKHYCPILLRTTLCS